MAKFDAFRPVLHALRRRCPQCGSGAISRHIAHVEPICPTCALDLERHPGSFIGGIGLNTVLAFIALLGVIVIGFVWTGGEASVPRILLPALTVAIVVPVLFYARSRLVWVAAELVLLPPDTPWVDPTTQQD